MSNIHSEDIHLGEKLASSQPVDIVGAATERCFFTFLRQSRIPNSFGSDSTIAGAVGVSFGQNAAINTIDQAIFEFQCIPCVASSTREFKLT